MYKHTHYLKLSTKFCHIPMLCSPAESSNGNPDVCCSYLNIPTCGQLIQCIVNENMESKAGEGKICLGFFLILHVTESFSSADGHEETNINVQ